MRQVLDECGFRGMTAMVYRDVLRQLDRWWLDERSAAREEASKSAEEKP